MPYSRTPHSTTLAEPLAAYSRAIVARLDAATNRDRWKRLSESERIDHLPPLVDALVDAALSEPSNRNANVALLENAFSHGEDRRTQGFDEELILEEYYILRDQAYRVLSQDVGVIGALEMITRIDPAVTRATVASLCGFHGRTLEPARALFKARATG